MLTKKQFDLLSELEHSPASTQRMLAKKAGMSLGAVNKTSNELASLGYCENGRITEAGLSALEPYRVKRAVIMAAGFGSRLVPVTLNTPKPLDRVNGKRIIDSLLDAIVGVGITEIYLVRGYLSEQFDQLLAKYPTIKLIENPFYNEANNISSVMCARSHLQNAYVCEADLLLYNPDLIKKYQYSTNYLGVPVEKTDDWCFTCKNGYISKMSIGGVNCFHMFGISYWNDADGARLAKHIEQVYDSPGGKERYWDQVAFDYFPDKYQITVRECTFDDIAEIDTYKELCKIDPAYCVRG